MDLPFKLSKTHKSEKKSNWIRSGLIMDNFDEIYNKYIYATNCDLCDKVFPNTKDRQMEHDHKTGEFRNIVCMRCNAKKSDKKIQGNNTSGYKHIAKCKNSQCKQGYYWQFQVQDTNGKQTKIKSSVDLDRLIHFRDKWIIDKNYHT